MTELRILYPIEHNIYRDVIKNIMILTESQHINKPTYTHVVYKVKSVLDRSFKNGINWNNVSPSFLTMTLPFSLLRTFLGLFRLV